MPAHPSTKCSHEENRSKICGPCGKKLVIGKKKISNFRLTENHESDLEVTKKKVRLE